MIQRLNQTLISFITSRSSGSIAEKEMSAEWEESGEREGIARDCQAAGSGLDRGGK